MFCNTVGVGEIETTVFENSYTHGPAESVDSMVLWK